MTREVKYKEAMQSRAVELFESALPDNTVLRLLRREGFKLCKDTLLVIKRYAHLPSVCKCGRAFPHTGWCWWRVQHNPKRQAYDARGLTTIIPHLGLPNVSLVLLGGKTQRLCAWIDSEDTPKVADIRWRALRKCRTFYAIGGNDAVKMHRLIMPDAPKLDHKNNNGLDNRKSNLRAATNAQNSHNTRPHLRNRTGFKGVSYRPKCRLRPWYALVVHGGERHNAGYYSTAEEAARAVDAKAIELRGEYAWLNFPKEIA